MKEKLNDLIIKNKIVVGVYQNTDDNYNKINKMILKNVWEDEKSNTMNLLAFLYRKTILKSNNLRISYNYNYSDNQTISITESYTNYDNTITKTKYVFYNIPTKLGYLDIHTINDKM